MTASIQAGNSGEGWSMTGCHLYTYKRKEELLRGHSPLTISPSHSLALVSYVPSQDRLAKCALTDKSHRCGY